MQSAQLLSQIVTPHAQHSLMLKHFVKMRLFNHKLGRVSHQQTVIISLIRYYAGLLLGSLKYTLVILIIGYKQMEKENITKSIIYGNNYENRYGRFLPICSSISDRASISSILDYLKQSAYFKKFNRIAYAFRVDEMPVVFITEKKNVETQYFEGCHSDEMIEGSGEKLLHLLQKFNIRNVVIAVLIQQFNPLLPFQCTNYRAIVQNSRLLLNELYKKVVHYNEQVVDHRVNDLLLNDTKTVEVKKVDMLLQSKLPGQSTKNMKPPERPNYVIANTTSKPSSIVKRSVGKKKKTQQTNYYSQQLTFLWGRTTNMKQQYKKLLTSLSQKQLQQIKYYILYDKNSLLNLVIELFMVYLNIESKQYFLEEYDLKLFVNQLQLQIMPKEQTKKIDQILKINKKLSVDSVMKANRSLGIIFSIIQIRLRYTKSMERIKELVQKEKIRMALSNGTSEKNDANHGIYVDENSKKNKAVFIDQS